MTTNAHPICLLARTESDAMTIFYCFYVITYLDGEYKVTMKIPEYRDQMLDTVQVFLPYNSKRFTGNCDGFGVSTITISDGTRYYAYYKGYKDRVFIGYSKIFFTSFARNVFELLNYECADELRNTLHCLCEFPIQPACGLAYDLKMRGGSALLSFSSVEQADDEDMSLVAMRFLTPSMLVTCWEAIMMERNVLVIGIDESIVAMCCEFIRKLSLPLNYCNIYIPQLLPELMEVVRESPIPYIIGVSVETLKLEGIRLDQIDAVILDINTGVANSTRLYSQPNIARAPSVLIQRLVAKVNSAYNNPALSQFCNRPSNMSQNLNPIMVNSFSSDIINHQADNIIGIFSTVNLALLGARSCTYRGLYRRITERRGAVPEFEFDNVSSSRSNRRDSKVSSSAGKNQDHGFTKHHDYIIGIMHMLRDIDDTDPTDYKKPHVWVEMDTINYCVYEHADDLPLLCIAIKDIESVAPSPIEPEGQVFDLVTTQTTYKFMVQYPDLRVKWLESIEEYLNSKDSNPPLQEATATTPGNASSGAENTQFSATPKTGDLIDADPSKLDFNDEAQDVALTKFRALFMKTQMVSYLSSTTENNGYESYLKTVGSNLLTVMNNLSSYKEKSTAAILAHSSLTVEIILSNLYKALSTELKSPKEYIDAKVKERHEQMKEKKKKHAHVKGLPGSGPNSRNTSVTSMNSLGSSSSSAGIPSLSSPSSGSNSNPGNNNNVDGENKGFFKSIISSFASAKEDPERADQSSDLSANSLQFEESTKRILGKNSEEEYKNYEAQNAHIRLVINSFRSCDLELNKSLVANRMLLAAKMVHVYSEIRKNNQSVESIQIDMCNINAKINAKVLNGWRGSGRTPTKIDTGEFNRRGCLGPDGLISDLDAKKELESPSLWIDSIWALLGINFESEEDLLGGLTSTASVSPPAPPAAPLGKPPKAWQIQDEYSSYNSMVREIFVHCMIEQKEGTKSDSKREHLEDILNVIIGHIYFDLKDTDKCLEYFDLGHNLNNQSYVMKLLVEKLSNTLCLPGKVDDLKANILENGNQVAKGLGLGGAGGSEENLGGDLVEKVDKAPSLAPASSSTITSILQFLCWARKHGNCIGLQAYKLVMSILNQINLVTLNEQTNALNGRDLLSLEARRTLANSSKGLELRKASQYLSEMHVSSNRRGVFSAPTKDFTWHPNPDFTEVLNETYICDKMIIAQNPCQLSITMLTQLREILKNHCRSRPTMNLNEQLRKATQSMISVPIVPGLFDDLIQSSAMRRFYIQCSKFQKVDLSELTQDQLVLFFTNMYNIITVHSIIINNKGAPGNNNLDRSAFMKWSQYNIGDLKYSLMDIENCILRNASSIQMVLGPLTHLVSFDVRDPRRKFLILEPRPEVTFCLFTASVSSPSLQVLRDAEMINVEMRKYARQYFVNHMSVEIESSTIQLPGLVYQFWADFGGSDPKLLRTNGLRAITKLMNGGPEKIYNSLCEICRNKVTLKQLKMNFTQIDWTAAILIDK